MPTGPLSPSRHRLLGSNGGGISSSRRTPSPSRRRSRAASLGGLSLQSLTALLPARMPPLRWLAPRLAVGALLFNLALQLRVLQGFFGLHRGASPLQRDGGPLCHPYDPVARPGLTRIEGVAFNFTSATPEASPDRLFQGRGVVMAASGSITRQAAGAFVTAFAIRRVLKEEAMPIEIFHAGPEEAFSGPVKAALESLGNVRLRDLEAALADLHAQGLRSVDPLPAPETLRSYAAKAYAVQACSFREALLLDAGALPFVATERFFALPSYRRYGLALFSDYVAIAKAQWAPVLRGLCLSHRPVARAFGGRELDSSCVVMDKVANADALAVTLALNGPLQARTYGALVGDKDTWGLGMLHVGKHVSVEGLEPGYLLVAREEAWEGRARARKVGGHLQFYRDPVGQALVPLHHNNQLLDLREYPALAADAYMETFAHLGDVLLTGTRRRDCRPFPVEDLMRLTPAMHETYLAVAEALRAHGVDHCACRDDWISCEADVERMRQRRWPLRLIDAWSPKRRKRRRGGGEGSLRRR